jgi:hypothetical protein
MVWLHYHRDGLVCNFRGIWFRLIADELVWNIAGHLVWFCALRGERFGLVLFQVDGLVWCKDFWVVYHVGGEVWSFLSYVVWFGTLPDALPDEGVWFVLLPGGWLI